MRLSVNLTFYMGTRSPNENHELIEGRFPLRNRLAPFGRML